MEIEKFNNSQINIIHPHYLFLNDIALCKFFLDKSNVIENQTRKTGSIPYNVI